MFDQISIKVCKQVPGNDFLTGGADNDMQKQTNKQTTTKLPKGGAAHQMISKQGKKITRISRLCAVNWYITSTLLHSEVLP